MVTFWKYADKSGTTLKRTSIGVHKKYFESGHITSQIKGNGAKSTTQAHILSLRTPQPLGGIKRLKPFFLSKSSHACFVCLFCCFTFQVNSYGHGGMVSSPNHTFSLATLYKQLTSTSCTFFHL